MWKSPVGRIVIAQGIATVILAGAAFLADLVSDSAALEATLAAGAVGVLPGVYLAAMSVREVPLGATGIGLALKGEAGRFLMSGVGFALVFVFLEPLNVWVFFGVFIGLQVFYVAVPLLLSIRAGRQDT